MEEGAGWPCQKAQKWYLNYGRLSATISSW
jgi:hypothetical protein